MLVEHGDTHYVGLWQAAHAHRRKLSASVLRRVRAVDVTLAVMRHVTSASCAQLVVDLRSQLASEKPGDDQHPQRPDAAGFDPWAEAVAARGLAPRNKERGAYWQAPDTKRPEEHSADEQEEMRRQDFYIGDAGAAEGDARVQGGAYWQAPDANHSEENRADEMYHDAMHRIKEQADALDLRHAQAAAQSEAMRTTLQVKLDELDLRRGQAAIAQSARLEAMESRLASVEAQRIAADGQGDHIAWLETELTEADRRFIVLEGDLANTDSKVDSLMARFGDLGMSDILQAVQAAAEERRSTEDAIKVRLEIMEAQQRATERTISELRCALDELVIADGLFPRKHAAARPKELHEMSTAEAYAVHMEGAPDEQHPAFSPRETSGPPTPPNAVDLERYGYPFQFSEGAHKVVDEATAPASVCSFLSRADLCRVRAVSMRHAFLPGLGSPAPRTAQQPRARRRRPIGFGSGAAASNFQPPRGAHARTAGLGQTISDWCRLSALTSPRDLKVTSW